MKLIICKQALNTTAAQEVAESWELNKEGKAEVTFSQSPTGAFYKEVRDRATKATLFPQDGLAFLNALHARLKKTPFTSSYILDN
jgi:hypothetical protein